MARVVLPIAGAVVGSFFGAPQIGFAVGGILGGIVDPLKINGPGIGDLQVQTGRENVPRAIIYGTAAVAGNLIFSGTPKVIKKKKKAGKGAPKVTTTTQTLTFAIRVAEGPIGGIIRIWEDEALVYDKRSTPDIPAADTAKFAAGINIHLGGEDQLPDAAIEAEVGVDLAPYHRGSAYVVFVNKDLTDRGGRIPQYRFEVSANAGVMQQSDTLDWQTIFTMPATDSGATFGSIGVSGNNILAIRFVAGDPNSNVVWGSSDAGMTWYPIAVPTTGPPFNLSNNQSGVPAHRLATGSWWFAHDNTGSASTGFPGAVSDTIPPSSFSVPITDLPFQSQARATAESGGTAYLYMEDPSSPSFQSVFSTFDGLSFTFRGNVTGLAAEDVGNGVWNVAASGTTIIATSGSGASGRHLYIASTAAPASLTEIAPPNISDLLIPGVTNAVIASLFYDEAAGRFVLKVVNFSGNADRPAQNEIYFASVDLGSSWQEIQANATDPTFFDDNLIAANANYWYRARGSIIERSLAPLSGVAVNPGDPVPLSAIVADISDRAQVPAGNIDVSELTGTVDGYSLGGFFTAAAAIEPLRGGHFFDAGEWDGKIHFVPRGGPSVATITVDDLVEDPEETRRGQAMEFPRKLHLEYQNATIGYAPTKHTAERISPDIRVTGESRVSTAEVMTSDEAARRSNIMLKLAWIEAAGEVTFAVADNFSWLTPSDIITLSVRGRSRRLRIEKTEIADGIMRLTCKPDRASAYQSTATGSVILPPRPPASTNPGVTVWHWLNIPALTDNADLLGSYFAAAGASEGWAGALLQRSIDAGASYEDTVTSEGAIIGTLLDPLPFAPAEFADTQNVLRVSLVNPGDALESVTYEQMLMERNAVAIGGPGAWEIVQYQTAVEESPGVWALSTLLRGRLNTVPSSHAANGAFVELSGVAFVANPISQIGVSLTHRGVGINASPEAATVMTETYSPPRTQYEWAPEALSGTIVGSTLSAEWIPRHRFGTSVSPVPSINFAGYRVTVAGTGGTVEQDTATPNADIDITGLSAPITLSVAMLNRITGPGEVAQLEVA